MTIIPNALPRVRAAIDAGILTSGTWGDGNGAVCMMSAAVPGAGSTADCVTAGWPEWLAGLNVSLFDSDIGVEDEAAARNHFALSVALAVEVPVDMDRAVDLFMIRRLDTGEHSALKTLRALKGDWSRQIEAVEMVVSLLNRRLNGENVDDEMRLAAATARSASRVAGTRSRTAISATNAAHAAHAAHTTSAASAASAVRSAAYDAHDSDCDARAVCLSARDAGRASYDAARTDLIASINEART